MNCKICPIEYMKPEYLMTELRFNIAAARAEKAELMKLELTAEERLRRREYRSVLVRLRQLKKEGVVQFFATEKDFTEGSTEAVYLLNKFPELAEAAETATEDGSGFLIIRL